MDLLGEYLRARRGRVRPTDVGLPGAGMRRVPGLRREEVALLAGISADYYLRLEQGRGGQASEQVLRSLARVLQLDGAATEHLLSLARPRPSPIAEHRVPSSVRNLLDVVNLPAFVTGQRFDVLAANPQARLISPELVTGNNRLRSVFLVPAERALYTDWYATAQRFVALVRDVVGIFEGDPAFRALIAELRDRSTEFATLWDRHDIVNRDNEVASLHHPVVGDLKLHIERLDLPGVPGQSLVVYHAQTGSRDAALLADLFGGQSSEGA